MTTGRWSEVLVYGVVLCVCVLFVAVGCGTTKGGGGGGGGGGDGVPEEFTNADAARGGGLYDKWWTVAGVGESQVDHPFWAGRPDTESNERTGSDTWRCKECHGWDYKGENGAYEEGSHRTGFAGILGTALSAQEAFDELKDGHSFGDMTDLTDDDIWDLARFVLEGLIDTDDILDGDAFVGSADAGRALYDSTCAGCHGDDGLAIPPGGDDDHDDWVGKIANENAWEFAHKVRFGQPGTAMPPQADLLTAEQISDLGAYAQTLPTSSDGNGEPPVGGPCTVQGANAEAGGTVFGGSCAVCHGDDGTGGIGPDLTEDPGTVMQETFGGGAEHNGNTLTDDEIRDVACWLSQQG